VNDCLDQALRLASRRWSVVPLHSPMGDGCSCGKRGRCPSAGKHPRTVNGVKDATIDENRIRAWWRQWPSANVGVATGALSGLIVVDIDPRNGGSLNAIEVRYGQLPTTIVSESGGGGLHILFSARDGKSCDPPGLMGVNLLADGKLFVAPPSWHSSGRRYAWSDGCGPGDVQLAIAPKWLIGVCRRPCRSPITPPRASTTSSTRALIGSANRRVESAVVSMLRCGLSSHEVDGSWRLIRYARRAVHFGLSASEAVAAIRAAELVHPFPRVWSDEDVLRRLHDAAKRYSTHGSSVTVPRRIASRIYRRAASRG
jgi:Bifunctional DNA primase/polymerase, N-terminal